MQLLGIGWYVAACIIMGVVGGLLLDNELGASPALTLLGLALGLAAAGWGGYRMLQTLFAAQARTAKAAKSQSTPSGRNAPPPLKQNDEEEPA